MTPDSSGKATVDPAYHWQRIDRNTPRGTKLQLIHEDYGVAQYGTLGGSPWHTHWAPLPTFKKN